MVCMEASETPAEFGGDYSYQIEGFTVTQLALPFAPESTQHPIHPRTGPLSNTAEQPAA